MKILVVDDDPIQCKITEHALLKGKHEVIVLDNAEDAQAILQQGTVHFVITDWMMPGMDGPAFTHWIRSQKTTGYVYIIFLTSREGPRDIESGLSAGADDYIKKPFNSSELLARVAVGERILQLEENLRKAAVRLEQQALTDDLTGLMNRRAMYQIGRQEIARARRNQSPLSILFLDLDKFKLVNDTYGHPAGDEALKLAARLISSNTRVYDQIGRWAGDEFIILLPDANREQALQVVERIHRSFENEPLVLNHNDKLTLRASIGLYSMMPGGEKNLDIDTLIRDADRDMYRVKHSKERQ
jgi:two-component system, cell cycle response regulator